MTPDQKEAVIATIRTLGFVGNTHYCSGCLNEFHLDRGQHDPECSVLKDMTNDEDWWDELKERLV